MSSLPAARSRSRADEIPELFLSREAAYRRLPEAVRADGPGPE